MPDQKLTDEQVAKIQEILRTYRAEADRIIDDHRQKVKKILEEMDQKKMEELQQLLNDQGNLSNGK